MPLRICGKKPEKENPAYQPDDKIFGVPQARVYSALYRQQRFEKVEKQNDDQPAFIEPDKQAAISGVAVEADVKNQGDKFSYTQVKQQGIDQPDFIFLSCAKYIRQFKTGQHSTHRFGLTKTANVLFLKGNALSDLKLKSGHLFFMEKSSHF